MQIAQLWSQVVENLPVSERTFFVVSTFLAHESFFVVLNVGLFLIHHFNLFEKYKIPTKQYPSPDLIKECLKHLAVNHFFVQWPVLWLSYGLLHRYGLHMSSELPSLFEIAKHLLVFVLCEDTLFYWAHRLLHHPRIYKHIHKQHHRFKATVGIASEYAHPLEYLLSNSIPFAAGPLLVGPHIVTWLLWVILRVVETVDAHSGYRFPFSPFSLLPFQGGSERHFFHHSHNIGSYGSFFNYWDYITGTDRAFREFQKNEQQQHNKNSNSNNKVRSDNTKKSE